MTNEMRRNNVRGNKKNKVLCLLVHSVLLLLCPVVWGSPTEEETHKLRGQTEAKILHAFHSNPTKTDLKCCLCKEKGKDTLCKIESHRIKRDSLERIVSGEKCQTLCKSYGRTYAEKKNPEECAKNTHCSLSSLPEGSSKCCGCGGAPLSGTSDTVCYVDTLRGNPCQKACMAFGREKVDKHHGRCTSIIQQNEESQRKTLCATVERYLPGDVVPMIKSRLGGPDSFDIVSWIRSHNVGLFLPSDSDTVTNDAIQSLESFFNEPEAVTDDTVEPQAYTPGIEEIGFSALTDIHDFEKYTDKALKYSGYIAQVTHHGSMGLVLSHFAGAMAHSVSLVTLPLQGLLVLFRGVIVPWGERRDGTLQLNTFTSSATRTAHCTEHVFETGAMYTAKTGQIMSDTIKMCGQKTWDDISNNAKRTRDAVTKFTTEMRNKAKCIGGEFWSGKQNRECFKLVSPSLTGLPGGLWTEFALRLQVWAELMKVLTRGERRDDTLQLNLPGCCGDLLNKIGDMFNVLAPEVVNALRTKLQAQFILTKELAENDKEKLGAVCSSAVLETSLHHKVFRALYRTQVAYFKHTSSGGTGGSARHWRYPSLDPSDSAFGIDGNIVDNAWRLASCNRIFNPDGTCTEGKDPEWYGKLMHEVPCQVSKLTPLWSHSSS